MFLRSFKLLAAMLLAVLLSVACGGDSAPAPTGLVATPGESSVTLTWDSTSGVEYWVFSAPVSTAPTDTKLMSDWIGLYGGGTWLNVSSPYVVSGLVNGASYSFSVNGRTSGGPGGPGATPVTATPRLAGTSWKAGTAITGRNDLRAITYGSVSTTSTLNSVTTTTTTSSTYVAAGAGGAMYSSTDGTNWTAINYATTSQLNGASYFGSYKLVGDGGTVLTSTDAVTWTQQSSGTTQNLYAIASNYTNLNVAVGANGTIISSADGVTWTAATTSATSNHLYAVTYGIYNSVGTWIAVGAAGTIVESSDGLTWHSVTSGSAADLQGIAYGAVTSLTGTTLTTTSTFVAVGASGTVLRSVDGVSWTASVPPVATNLKAIVYGTQYVAVGAGGNIFISADGLSWTLASPAATSNDLYAVVHGLYTYAAVGAAGTNLLAK